MVARFCFCFLSSTDRHAILNSDRPMYSSYGEFWMIAPDMTSPRFSA